MNFMHWFKKNYIFFTRKKIFILLHTPVKVILLDIAHLSWITLAVVRRVYYVWDSLGLGLEVGRGLLKKKKKRLLGPKSSLQSWTSDQEKGPGICIFGANFSVKSSVAIFLGEKTALLYYSGQSVLVWFACSDPFTLLCITDFFVKMLAVSTMDEAPFCASCVG